jgi:hypothetical protein
MSGGSLNYLFYKVEEAAHTIHRGGGTALHRAFAAHLDLVAKALRDVEWVLSGDYGEGQDREAIRACLPKNAELAQLISEAREARDALDEALTRAEERA